MQLAIGVLWKEKDFKKNYSVKWIKITNPKADSNYMTNYSFTPVISIPYWQ
jgi:hypothetical protein